MFLLLLFIRLFERQRNGRVAKLPLRTFFAFAVAVAVAVAVTARAYFTLFDVLLWACVSVCVRALHFRVELFCILQLHTEGWGCQVASVHSFSHSLSRAPRLSLSLARSSHTFDNVAQSPRASCCYCFRLVARFFIIVLQWRRNKHTRIGTTYWLAVLVSAT